MLYFSTEFPISGSKTAEQFVDTTVSWILESPHTDFLDKDLEKLQVGDNVELRKGNQTLRLRRAKMDKDERISLENILLENEVEWKTTVVFSREAADGWVGIATSRESSNPIVRLPSGKKPIIVRSILNKLGGGKDGELDVGDTAHVLGNNDIELASRLITGAAGCYLPVVYISTDYSNKLLIDPGALASDLSGMAHVVTEPNRSFSRRLQIEVNSENVYGGTVGIYWPDASGRRSFFIGRGFESPIEIKRAINYEIRTALVNRRPLYRCTSAAVEEAISKKAIEELKSSGSNEVDKYIENFDKELKAKSIQIEVAEREISRLKAEIRKFESKSLTSQGISLKVGQEQDLYDDEVLGIILETINDAAELAHNGSRRQHVLSSIAAVNPKTKILKFNREKVKAILRDYKSMDKSKKDDLESLGFSISEEGKHYKLVYLSDGRYTFALSKSGSDHRSGLNLASDISKLVF